jgi:hypothetical protein
MNEVKLMETFKLIVASEFFKYRSFGFTTILLAPAVVFIGVPLHVLFGDLDISPIIIFVFSALVMLTIHYTLKRYAKKWQFIYAERIKRDKKQIFKRFVCYFGSYWVLSISFALLANHYHL